MDHAAAHKLDKPISDLQARIDATDCPTEQDKLQDILHMLMDMRAADLEAMDPKDRCHSVWVQRMENDTWDLY